MHGIMKRNVEIIVSILKRQKLEDKTSNFSHDQIDQYFDPIQHQLL